MAGKPALTTKKPRRTSSVQIPEKSTSKLHSKSSKSANGHARSNSGKVAPSCDKIVSDKRSKIKRSGRVGSNEEESDEEEAKIRSQLFAKRRSKMDAKEAPSEEKDKVTNLPLASKRQPFQPVIKSKGRIGRRASSIEPRDDGGETLSWSEIRKRRKASAPLIKVVLKQDATSDDIKISSPISDAKNSPKIETLDEAPKDEAIKDGVTTDGAIKDEAPKNETPTREMSKIK